MGDATVVEGPWRPQPGRATGKGWRAMWTPEADALHGDLLLEVQRQADGPVHVIICNAADRVRVSMGPAHREAVIEACLAFSIWIDQFADGAPPLRAIEALLELRCSARGWDA